MADITDFASKFHFTQEMIDGPIYRKYEKAMRKIWTVDELDFAPDAADWQSIDERQRERPARRHQPVPRRRAGGHRRAGPDARRLPRAAPVRLDHVPVDVPAGGGQARRVLHALAQARWSASSSRRRSRRTGSTATQTIDPSGRFVVRDVLHEALPRYGSELMEAIRGGDEADIERGVRPLLGRLQRLRRGRADDAVVRDRDRHLRRLGQVRRRSSRASG